jgi:hypothetical protein
MITGGVCYAVETSECDETRATAIHRGEEIDLVRRRQSHNKPRTARILFVPVCDIRFCNALAIIGNIPSRVLLWKSESRTNPLFFMFAGDRGP